MDRKFLYGEDDDLDGDDTAYDSLCQNIIREAERKEINKKRMPRKMGKKEQKREG